jgi:hypothetical protein
MQLHDKLHALAVFSPGKSPCTNSNRGSASLSGNVDAVWDQENLYHRPDCSVLQSVTTSQYALRKEHGIISQNIQNILK